MQAWSLVTAKPRRCHASTRGMYLERVRPIPVRTAPTSAERLSKHHPDGRRCVWPPPQVHCGDGVGTAAVAEPGGLGVIVWCPRQWLRMVKSAGLEALGRGHAIMFSSEHDQ